MRCDGVPYKVESMMYLLAPYFMMRRSDACNAISVYIPYEPIKHYISEKRKEGFNTSAMVLVLSAYLRTLAHHPAMNRFVANKRIYSRKGVWVGMVVQRAKDAQETMGKFQFDLHDTIYDVNRKVTEFVETNRNEQANPLDAIMPKLLKLSWLMPPAMAIARFADKHGLLPASLIAASPFHCSMVMSNLASIRTNHIHHHIYDFGTVGQTMTIGVNENRAVEKNGQIVLERMMPLGIVCDERLADGQEYARFFTEMKHYLAHPELMEVPPETVITDF